MYQLVARGKHPWHIKGEKNPDVTLNKLKSIERGDIDWNYPDNLFSPMAKDFFEKLCSYPSSIRYDAERAL